MSGPELSSCGCKTAKATPDAVAALNSNLDLPYRQYGLSDRGSIDPKQTWEDRRDQQS